MLIDYGNVIKTKDIVWLLDVDGVLNASKAGWSAAPRSGWAYAESGVSWRMRWAPQLMARVRQVHQNPRVMIVWATSWCGMTDQLETLFNLPQLTSAWSSRMYNIDKQSAALDVLEAGFKLIWTDDEAIPADWDSDESKLLIRPRSNRGLRPEHLDLIDKFVIGS
jgi:Swiss Army Knife RNA repair-like protein